MDNDDLFADVEAALKNVVVPEDRDYVRANTVMGAIDEGDIETAEQLCRDAPDPAQLAFTIALLAVREITGVDNGA